MTVIELNTEQLYSRLKRLPETAHYWVAFSGGVDSLVLLHLMKTLIPRLNADLSAIHVHHGLHKEADDWQQTCQKQCAEWHIPFKTIRVDAKAGEGDSPEAKARELRYGAIVSIAEKGDVILTAHHQDDQIETFFLQMLRGSGPDGLASMPLLKDLDNAYLARPLLEYNRQQIEKYAQEHQLNWLQDHSNDDVSIDRNYLRLKVLPLLQQRWPGMGGTLNRVVQHQNEVGQLLKEYATSDFNKVCLADMDALDADKLKQFSESRQKNIIRYWLGKRQFQMPSTKKMKHILSDILFSHEERSPLVSWQGCEVRRFRNAIFSMESLKKVEHDKGIHWQLNEELKLGLGILKAKKVKGKGIKRALLDKDHVEIRFRKGGEKIKFKWCNSTRELKKIFQEERVLPWYRSMIPLVYVRDELAQVVGFGVSQDFIAEGDEDGWEIDWSVAELYQLPNTRFDKA